MIVSRKIKYVVFFLVLLIIFAAYAVQSLESFSLRGSNLRLINNYSSNLNNFHPTEIFDYVDGSTQDQFKVQIITFDDSGELDGWIKSKVEKSSESREIDGNVVFLDENKNYVFWRSGNVFVQIFMNNKISQDQVFDETLVEGLFSGQLIDEYLLKYPNACLVSGCASSHSVDEGLNWFENSDVHEEVNSYWNEYLFRSRCPMEETGWEKFREKSSEEYIALLRASCKDIFQATADLRKPVPDKIKECGSELNRQIINQDITDYNQKMILEECVLRNKFGEENTFLSQSEKTAVFLRRDDSILRQLSHLRDKEYALISSLEGDVKLMIDRKNTSPSKLAEAWFGDFS